jgi:hypothetical protein
MVLLFAVPPAEAGTRHLAPAETVEVRDAVFAGRGPAGAFVSATALGGRYALNDGSDDSIAVEVTAACREECDAADPQAIADAIGTFIHGPEVNLLTVQLDTPFQLGFDCGFEAQACYFAGENRIVISGSDDPAPDGAGREFVLAHEYGHHVAAHRDLPAPFPATIDWGTERWASVENVCRGHQAGDYFPGDEERNYYEDPGEAFAESFAFNRYPDAGVEWAWTSTLRPSAAALRALRRDVLRPWGGRRRFAISGRVRRGGTIVRGFRTPFDGRVSIGPVGRPRLGYELTIRNRAGKPLRSSRQGVSNHHRLDFTVCGQSRLRVAVRAKGRAGKRFRLTVQRP